MNKFKKRTLISKFKSNGYNVEDIFIHDYDFDDTRSYYLKYPYKDTYAYLYYFQMPDGNSVFKDLHSSIEFFAKSLRKAKNNRSSFRNFIIDQLTFKINFDSEDEIDFDADVFVDFTNDLMLKYKNPKSFLLDLESINYFELISY